MATFSFFGTMRLTEVKKTGYIIQIFLEVFCKVTCFPSVEVTSLLLFDPVVLMNFLNDCEKDIFRLSASFFRNFHLDKGYPFVFMADFGLRKSSFASWKLLFRRYETFR